MGPFYFCGLISFAMAFCGISFAIKEKKRRRKLRRKCSYEDRVLHELTACKND